MWGSKRIINRPSSPKASPPDSVSRMARATDRRDAQLAGLLDQKTADLVPCADRSRGLPGTAHRRNQLLVRRRSQIVRLNRRIDGGRSGRRGHGLQNSIELAHEQIALVDGQIGQFGQWRALVGRRACPQPDRPPIGRPWSSTPRGHLDPGPPRQRQRR